MVTHFLGREQVAAYLLDFLQRLKAFDPFPAVRCPMTPSGKELLAAMLPLLKDCDCEQLFNSVEIVPIEICQKTDKIRFEGKSAGKAIKGKSVLLFDSAIHSGSTMARSLEKILAHGATSVCTYALVVKRCSAFIPTMWGLMVDETDRAFFLLNAIPNHRLHTSSKRKPAALHIQRLSKEDLEKPFVKTGVKSMDRITWGDRYFDMVTTEQDRCSYVLKEGSGIAGYLTVHRSGKDFFVIDEVAVDKKHQEKGWGGILMRFADTLARQSNCRFVRLYAIASQLNFYVKHDYEQVSPKPICVDGESYFLMQRVLLHHSSLY